MYFPSMVCKSDITMSNNMIYAKSSFLTRCPAAPITSAKPAFRRPPLVTFRCIKNQENTHTRGWLAPLEPETPVGKLLSDALLEDQSSFLVKARKELAQLAAERDEDEARLKLSLGVDEDCLFRRMAETKKCGRQEAVEEILYTLIVYKFSEIKFPLIPPLSKLADKSLELLPLSDVELESFYHSEVLELVKKKLDDMFLKLLYDVTDDACARTDTPDIDLYQQYIELVKFGYFLKSTFFRYRLELRLKESGSDGMRFRGFLDKMTCMCKEQRSKEVIRMRHKHAIALLSGYSEEISMSYANVMRFLQEAVAFGSFLWEMESWVDALYPLDDQI